MLAVHAAPSTIITSAPADPRDKCPNQNIAGTDITALAKSFLSFAALRAADAWGATVLRLLSAAIKTPTPIRRKSIAPPAGRLKYATYSMAVMLAAATHADSARAMEFREHAFAI
jgi:hypothetical protein